MMQAYQKKTGRMAEELGLNWVGHDYCQRIFRRGEISRQSYRELSAFYQQAGEVFVAVVKN